MSDLVARAYETIEGWLALGHAAHVVGPTRFVREPRAPDVYDANYFAWARASEPEAIDVLLAEVERVYAGLGHRHYLWDPGTPATFEARLRHEGWQVHDDVVLVLEGRLDARPPAVDLRLAETDADWETLTELCWLDHQEEVRKGFHAAWPRALTEALVAIRRRKAPAVRWFLARRDGVDCAFFSSWPGANGVGQVEDLFTREDSRGRGIATALIAACVDDARARGAREVLIGARPDDTPRQMYAALGFRPLCLQRSYIKT